ncbi:MAG: hypothetical protein A2V72_00370 [Candidatus Nealsonbacteria bacterium RBG_13_37_56]|uniref:Uncharacterized protein n=1 Tax=Candidatus Nealsonbacteria bacterium RBG_13_37_56 TaxID=1801661 RepID=A0A1G2DV51_9BACT|nr:MAG: hypothetical protein A2V72_00370 [Candidatus Nealsonbacteria bacterium RBG_13_37_56]
MKDFTNSVMVDIGRAIRELNLLIFSAVVVAIFAAIIIIAPGLLGNPIGDLLGKSGCPNCGDNWFWKPHGSIPVGPTMPLDVNNVEHIIYAEITHGIMICEECLANPAGLDEERIEQYLLSFPEGGWTLEETAKVKQAVILYKKEKLKNQQ